MYGPYLALGTALCWTISAVAFENASRRVGSVPVNLIRLVLAFALLTVLNAYRLGQPLPIHATSHQWVFLLLSGILGFSIGDLALFRAFVLLGSRLSTLLMCLAPIFAAVTEWIWMGNAISPLQFSGMFVTLIGVAWVVYEKPAELPKESPAAAESTIIESEARLAGSSTTVIEYEPKRGYEKHINAWSIFLGIVAALGQGVGLVCTKVAMTTQTVEGVISAGIDPFAATQIRIIAGLVTFSILLIFTRRVGDCIRALGNGKAMALMTLGAITGPFLGVSMLNKAVELIPSGVAQTITSLVPVLIIPVSIFVLKEHIKWQAVIGALVAVAGVAMLVF